ncbi:MAG TPA: PAS domain S-box protein, partial [Desulfobacteraceae bacterium]|nr:PAS domain S-box protein [Desulfobacteraceae bacterium]
NIARIDTLLAYTIHSFSDLFQAMHEKQILDYALRLEEDVRERTRELKVSQLKYKTLVEEINDGYFVVQNGVIVFANKAFCRMHGYHLKEVLGKEFQVFIDPGSRGLVLQIYDKSLKRSPAPHIFEYIRLTKDGGSFPTEITAKITNYENKPSNIGICRDITGRVKMEQRMREAERMAYIGQIATSLSHEIRNPLSAVKMNLQILKKNPELKGNDQRRIDISVREVIRLERILNELLDFAKPLQVQFAHTDLNSVLSTCSELLEMRLKEENLSIDSAFDPEMPKIWADAQKLEQAFINLLLNSIEASGQNGRIWIKSRYISDGNSPLAEVVIEDEGHGVSQEHMPDIFKPFFTTKSRGTGLGLSNVKRIVEVHGGRVEVENQKTRGASLKVFLPIGKNHV